MNDELASLSKSTGPHSNLTSNEIDLNGSLLPTNNLRLSLAEPDFVKAAERFAEIGLADTGPEFKRLRLIWSHAGRRALYFALADGPRSSEAALRVGMSRAEASTHLGQLESIGLASVRTYGKLRYYSASIGPLLEALGETSLAIDAIHDYFSTQTRIPVSREVLQYVRRHATLIKTAQVLSSKLRLGIYSTLSNQIYENGLTTTEILQLYPEITSRTANHNLKKLENAGLIVSTRYKMQDPNTYRASLATLITVINDFDQEFGEYSLVDLRNKQAFQAELPRNFISKSEKLCKALAVRSNLDTLLWLSKRGEAMPLRYTVERLGQSYTRQEERRVAELRNVGLIRTKSNVENGARHLLLTVNWKPLTNLLYGLLPA